MTPDVEVEEWRPVVGWEGEYEVSNWGRVRSLDRVTVFIDGRSRAFKGQILKQRVGWNGYPCVSLPALSQQGLRRPRPCAIHVLVLEAFTSPRPPGMVVCHNDGNPSNNHIENLRWDTVSANTLDKVRHGRHPQAGRTHCAKGHEYTDDNTYRYRINGANKRQCKTCVKRAARDRYRRNAARSDLSLERK